MTDFAQRVASARISEGGLGVFFLGQAGFVFKTPSGQTVAVDPYLSDCCERYFGFKRLMPHILDARDIAFHQLVITHAHYDHFDPDSVPALMAGGKTELIGARDILPECERLGLTERITILGVEESVTRGDLTVTGKDCDHGELAPDALGLLLHIGGKTVYVMGDTTYRPDRLDDPALQGVDLLILPINGAFGNLNEEQAARVVSVLKPQLTVPCHYWNFAEHGGDPGRFQQVMKDITPDAPYCLMRQGEGMTL